MTTETSEDSMPLVEQNSMLFGMIGLPLARMIHSGEINPETVSREELVTALLALGRTHEDAFEIYLTQIEEDMPLVAHCICQRRPRSGVVLLFTLIEAEMNSLIRILLRIRGFSPSKITDALKGSSFDTKLDVLLPLLDVEVPDRLRNVALQCKSIRNIVVHNKATPALMADIGIKDSDGELADERSRKFFTENPIERLQLDLKDFFELSINNDSAMQWSAQLFDKYFRGTEPAGDA
jgi:hypothetical protein